MAYHYEGYSEAVQSVMKMSEPELLRYLDDLYGRDRLPENASLEEIRAEALRQCDEEFTDTQSHEYEQVQFWTKVVKADMKYR